jgi:threonine dehydratase
VVTGLVCAVCGTAVPISQALSWKCPRATETDTHHVLHFENTVEPFRPTDDENPYLAFRKYLAVDSFGAAIGLSEDARIRIITEANAAVAAVAGTGFLRTPLYRSVELSDALGFTAKGGVWIKDETHNVAGSHKARHLFTELLHLLFAEAAGVAPWTSSTRPPLAIASCGNAAIAASTLAAAVQWPIYVHVPPAATSEVLVALASLDADVRVCPRLPDDAAGDPCVLRFREAVANGAIAFGVQGTENAWCLDGGRTIGWEMTEDLGHLMDRIFIQVGGGAFAACVGASLRSAGVHPKLHAVQTEGCAPLARAWEKALATGGARNAGPRWNECMWPWETTPVSIADGILDDETYDWIGVLDAMADTGGAPVVVSEQHVQQAYDWVHSLTSVNASATGVAGLAGLMAMRSDIANDERVVVVMSGVERVEVS